MTRSLQVAFAVNQQYAQYLGATILSLLAHHQDEQVTVHVLYQDLSAALLADLATFDVSQANLTLVYHQIDTAALDIPVRTRQFPIESFFRFLLPDLLVDVERVLYLDVDVLVKANLRVLFDWDLDGSELGAVRESDIYAYYQWYLDGLGFSPDSHYVSSGVLLMDLAAMRCSGTSKRLLEMAVEQAGELKFPDQDILNRYYKGNLCLLPPCYNYTDRRKLDQELPAEEVVIEHFNGVYKAWQALSKLPDYLLSSAEAYQAYQATYRELLGKPLVSLFIRLELADEATRQCLESLSEQIYANLRIHCSIPADHHVLHDLLSIYAKDRRFKVYKGTVWPSDVQVGTAFGFVSPQCQLDPHYVERLLGALSDGQADLALTTFAVFNQDQAVFRMYPEEFEEGQVYQSRPLLENLYRHAWLETEVHRSLYGKLYQHHLLAACPTWNNSDDRTLSLVLYLASERVVIGPSRLYTRRFEQANELVLETENQIVERLRDLEVYRQLLMKKGYDLTLFEAAYPEQLEYLRQLAFERGYGQALEAIISVFQHQRQSHLIRKV